MGNSSGACSPSETSCAQKDKFLVSNLIQLDSLQFDYTFYRTAVTCSVVYRDTISLQTSLLDSTLISSETTLISTEIDTLLSSFANDFRLSNFLKVFPLPTDEYITIEIYEPCYNYFGDKLLHLELYDINARLIYETTAETKQLPLKIDMGIYANGMYCLRASVDDDNCILKVIKEK